MPKDSKSRKVDKLVDKGSFGDRLRRRRIALESGDASGGSNTARMRRNQSTDSNQ